ncbi:MAG TPA: hypothetical protein VII78_07195 [Myxococcota bacterium]
MVHDPKPLDAAIQCDALIVGSGFAGMNAAAENRRRIDALQLTEHAVNPARRGRDGEEMTMMIPHSRAGARSAVERREAAKAELEKRD